MSTQNAFDRLAARVSNALSSENKVQLNAFIVKRIQSNPLQYMATSCSIAEKLKVLKHSVISTINANQDDKKLSQHLNLILFDFIIFENDSNTVDRPVIASKRKQLTPMKCVTFDVPMSVDRESTIASESIQTAVVNTVDINPVDQPTHIENPTQDRVEIVPHVENELIPQNRVPDTPSEKVPNAESHISVNQDSVSQRQSKRRRVRSKKSTCESSVKTAFPCNNVENPSDLGELDSWSVRWTQVAKLIESNAVQRWVEYNPTYFGIRCRSSRVKHCEDCLKALLLAPVTSNFNVEHTDEDELIPCSTSDFDLTDLHGMDRPTALLQTQPNMFARDYVPSIFYVGTHNKNASKPRHLSWMTGKLNRQIEYATR